MLIGWLQPDAVHHPTGFRSLLDPSGLRVANTVFSATDPLVKNACDCTDPPPGHNHQSPRSRIHRIASAVLPCKGLPALYNLIKK